MSQRTSFLAFAIFALLTTAIYVEPCMPACSKNYEKCRDSCVANDLQCPVTCFTEFRECEVMCAS